jgi:glycerol uptake facilitator-like aquaporin
MTEPILVAKGENEHFLLPQMANRHGLIAGATGTGMSPARAVGSQIIRGVLGSIRRGWR